MGGGGISLHRNLSIHAEHSPRRASHCSPTGLASLVLRGSLLRHPHNITIYSNILHHDNVYHTTRSFSNVVPCSVDFIYGYGGCLIEVIIRKTPSHGDIDLMGRSRPARKILLFPRAGEARRERRAGKGEGPRPRDAAHDNCDDEKSAERSPRGRGQVWLGLAGTILSILRDSPPLILTIGSFPT